MGSPRDSEWARAKALCRLSGEEVRMARELGLNPRKLVKNIPSPSQRWKLPVREWVRELYGKSHSKQAPRDRGSPPAPRASWSGEGRDFAEESTAADDFDHSWLDAEDEGRWTSEAFRAAADFVATAFAALAPVERVVLFGSVARPLERKPPRQPRFRQAGVTLPHEPKDVDLAVWLSPVTELKTLHRARSRALDDLLVQTGFGVAHHQVDVFLFEPGTDPYRGRLCSFGECPKGKPECLVRGCGATPFLRQHEDFVLDPRALEPRRTILLFDRSRPFGPPSLDRWGEQIPF